MSSPDEGVESGNASGSIMNLDSEVELSCFSSSLMQTSSSMMQGEPPTDGRKRSVCQDISSDDLHLLCDLFYLPYEHGAQGIHIMQEFQWLKTNSNVIAGASSKDKCKPEVSFEKFSFTSLERGFDRWLFVFRCQSGSRGQRCLMS